jgi:hypothetical protein
MRLSSCFLALTLLASPAIAAEDGWRPLFNGKDLTNWDTFMGKPNPAWDVPGLKRDENGAYLEPVGLNRDPLKVFTVVTVDGEPVVRISGQGTGAMYTKEALGNFHLRLQMKWGEKKWGAQNGRRNGGVLYFVHGEFGFLDDTWPRATEFQVMERDIGDLYALGSQISVPSRKEGNLFLFDPKGEPTAFLQKSPAVNRCVRLENAEKPVGEWNTLELVCLGDKSIHVVNGKVEMRLRDARRLDGESPTPITEGKIGIQTEGAELFVRRIEIRSIKEVPAEFAEH